MKDTVLPFERFIQRNQAAKVRLPYTRNSSLSTDYLGC